MNEIQRLQLAAAMCDAMVWPTKANPNPVPERIFTVQWGVVTVGVLRNGRRVWMNVQF